MDNIAALPKINPKEFNSWKKETSAIPETSMEEREKSQDKIILENTKRKILTHHINIPLNVFKNWAESKGKSLDENTLQKLSELMMNAMILPKGPLPSPEGLKERLNIIREKRKETGPFDWTDPYLRRPEHAVCPIFMDDCHGSTHIGSGVLVEVNGSHFLLTAAHVKEKKKTD